MAGYTRYMAVAMLVAALCGGCSLVSSINPDAIAGRYHRQTPGAEIGEPDYLMMEFIEFRPGGHAAVLLPTDDAGGFATTGLWRYRLLDQGRIEAAGRCWRGWTQFDCVRVYTVALDGDQLTIGDEREPARVNRFRRIGPAGADLPPELPPPFATDTPTPGAPRPEPTRFPQPTPP